MITDFVPDISAHNRYGQAFSLPRPIVHQEAYLDDRGEDPPGARSYETNQDVKWICRTLQRMEAQDLDFEARIRALERLSGGESGGGAAGLDGQRSRAGGVVGGVVAVIVRVLRRVGEEGRGCRAGRVCGMWYW